MKLIMVLSYMYSVVKLIITLISFTPICTYLLALFCINVLELLNRIIILIPTSSEIALLAHSF